LGSGGNGFSQNEIYEYDPQNDSWQVAGTYPGEGTYDLASFCINNKIYTGLGQTTSSYACSDFWEFNPTDRSWKKLNSSPTTLTPAISNTINNKGYVGYGWIGDYTYGTQPKGKMFLEFDPTKN
jgi:N-acetylneuraminic acid mutarotase